MNFHPEMSGFLESIAQQELENSRKEVLTRLANLLSKENVNDGLVNVNFVCTHNSRRSQIAELTLRLFADKFGLNFISTFSSGTEATALNHRVIKALQNHGFHVNTQKNGKNPHYAINYSKESEKEPHMFSKTIEHESHPVKMVAVMVCDDAEKNCPFISNAKHRFPLAYEDPKFSDDSLEEASVYGKKIIEIGSEMNFLCQLLSNS